MKEKIERLAKGIFEYEMPDLIVSESVLVVPVEAGMQTTGSICLKNSMSKRMKGVLYVTGKILVLEENNFVGTECEIFYHVNAEQLIAGEVHKGSISIISDCGEFELPFSVEVKEPTYKSSIGTVHDLFQFANLARVNRQEAEEFFVSENFEKIVLRKEEKYRPAYEQLIQSTDKARALEEFLVMVHKKKRCLLTCETTSLTLEAGKENFQESIWIRRNQWGYVSLSVSTTAPFLAIQKQEIGAEDFVNGQAEIRFVVDAEHLRPGRHYAEIICRDARQEIRIPVSVHSRRDKEEEYPWKNAKRLEAKLLEQYLQFRNGALTSGVYLAESGRILESLLALLSRQAADCEETKKKEEIEKLRQGYELYRAYLSVADNKTRVQEEAYHAVMRRRPAYERENRRFYCATLYLEAMKQRERALVEEYAGIIRTFYEQEGKDDYLLWFLLYMDKRLESNKLLRYETIRNHCRKGTYSPILIFEAASLWNADPLMIHSVGTFECHVMRYLVENHMVTKETAIQFAYLTEKNQEAEPLQLRLLKQLYNRFGHKDILAALCQKLIRTDNRDSKNHLYFKQGIREQLKTERLYEYYLHTLDKTENVVLEQQALLYFTYGNSLGSDELAFLYAYVVRHKDENPSIYRAYLKQMEQFAINRMKAGEINSHLAVLYADVLRSAIIDKEMAQVLPDIIFAYMVECTNPFMKQACVVHKEEKAAQYFPLREKNGVLYSMVPVYTENAEIFLVDAAGNYYLPLETDKIYRLLHAGNFVDVCYDMGSNNRKLLLHIAEKNKNYNKYDRTLIDLQKQMSQMNVLREEVRNNCILSLVDYYYENYDGELLESYLRAIRPELLSSKQREKILELMVLRDMYEEVITNVDRYGCAEMQTKRIAKLCVRGIYSPREEEDRVILLSMGIHAFHNGRIEDRLLQYLCDRYNGTTGEMYGLWQAAKAQELDTTALEERLLGQMLFAESYVENSSAVFFSYYNKGFNRKLMKAYLSYCAYKYFVKDRQTDMELFDILKKESFLENSQICILALLKVYAAKDTLLEAERSFIEFHIQKFVHKKMIFAFFKEFEGRIKLPACMTDKYYVEYRTNPRNRVSIHYSCRLDEDELKVEEMTDAGYGVFVKEIILFYGECLQYYISEEDENGYQIAANHIIQKNEAEHTLGNTKYEKINEILLTQDMHDEKTLFELLEQYWKEEYAVDRHFSPV